MIGDAYDHVVVMFSDIVGFSTMSSTMSAVEVFLMLTNLYYAFDRLVDKFGVYKVETIGDGYMIAAGTPLPDAAAPPRLILSSACMQQLWLCPCVCLVTAAAASVHLVCCMHFSCVNR